MDSKLTFWIPLVIWKVSQIPLTVFLNKRLSLQESNISLEKELLWKVLGNQVILFHQEKEKWYLQIYSEFKLFK